MGNLEEYISEVEGMIKKFKRDVPQDKLECTASIEECILNIHGSLQGWAKWVQSPAVMKKFTLEELQDYEKKMREFLIEFLELDLEASRKMLTKVPPKKIEERKQSYVS